jgi:23S rRNA pseudouridine2605 synthase
MKPEKHNKRTSFKKENSYDRKKSSGSYYKKDDEKSRPEKKFSGDKKDDRPHFGKYAKDKPERKFSRDERDEKKTYGKGKPADRKSYGSSNRSQERGPYKKFSRDTKEEKPAYGKYAPEKRKGTLTKEEWKKKKEQESENPSTRKKVDYKNEKKTYLERKDKRRLAGISSPTEGGKKTEREEKPTSEGIRLNKFLSNAGIAARRKADEYIKQCMVTVNGVVVTEMGHKVSRKDIIKFDGKLVRPGKNVYILLNKPKDAISTTNDDRGRKTVMDIVARATNERVYPVGRLDRNTTGVLLFTNDGELAEKLSHPRYNVKKIYAAELNKGLTQEDMKKIKTGIQLEEGLAKVDDIQYVDSSNKTLIGIEIHMGWNRIVRRIFETLGYEVKKLDRVMYAGLTKKDLPRGRWRHLNDKEVIMLKHFLKA